MAGQSTVYDVKIQYTLDDRASASMDHLAAKADETAKHVEGLSEGMKHLAELFMLREGFHLGKELFIDLNAEMQDMRISMAAITQYNLGGTFEDASKKVNTLIDGWRDFSTQTTLTTKQFVEFGSTLEATAFGAHATTSEFDELVRKGAVVGNILSKGQKGGLEYVSMELSEALSGNVRKSQMMNKKLLGPMLEKMGMELEDWNNLIKTQGPHKGVELILKALNDPAWGGAIQKQAKSWNGLLSTAEDRIQLLGMKIGDKLFGALSTELEHINKWIETHPKELEAFAEKFSSYLMTGFHAVKDAIVFLLDNKGTLMALGAAWGLGKALGPVGGNAGLGNLSFLGHLGGMFGSASTRAGWNAEAAGKLYNGGIDAKEIAQRAMLGVAIAHSVNDFNGVDSSLVHFNEGLSGVLTGLSALPGPIGAVSGALEALYVALSWIAGKIDQMHKEDVDKAGSVMALTDQLKGTAKHGDAGAIFTRAREMGAIDEQGHLNKRVFQDKLLAQMGEAGMDVSGSQLSAYARNASLAIETLSMDDRMHRLHKEGWSTAEPGKDEEKKPVGKGTNVTNVTISKIEVASDDPDRFVFGMVKAFDKFNKAPTQAAGALRGGA